MTPGDTKVQTHAQFSQMRYWPQLDGLRTVSILLVVIIHMGDKWWINYKGALAVVLFFVISGFLISSLLIREERRNGGVFLRGFYIRRVFRIAPLYYIALAITTFAAIGLGLGVGSGNFLDRLPLLATFNGDLAGTGSFVHSWSIGVEEKFYILWPIIGFAFLALRKHRALLLSVLLPIIAVAAYVPVTVYFGVYAGIASGCLLAVLMDKPRGYAFVSKLATPVMSNVFLLLAVLAFVFDFALPLRDESGLAHVPFAFATALAFPGILIGNGWAAKALSWRPLVFIGTRTYGIYLFHPLCIDIVGRLIPSGQTEAVPALLRFLLAAALSYAVAEVLFRIVEHPMTELGRRLSKRAMTRQQEPSSVSV